MYVTRITEKVLLRLNETKFLTLVFQTKPDLTADALRIWMSFSQMYVVAGQSLRTKLS